jgi:D-sedoheptulose 7-phosphate isomerase
MDNQTQYLSELHRVTTEVPRMLVEKLIATMEMAYQERRTIFIFGNGGSASSASHFAQDLSKGTITDFKDQRRLRVISLCDNISGITAWSNDKEYACIFEEQLKNLVHTKDIAIAISGSGKSPNVVRGIQYAKGHGMKTIAFTGYDGGVIGHLVDLNIHVPSTNMGMVEAAHGVIMHYIVDALKERLFAIWEELEESAKVLEEVEELNGNGASSEGSME